MSLWREGERMSRTIKIAFLQREWEDNLGMLWISALLRQNGFETRVWVEEQRTYAEIKEFGPTILGYKCLTGDQKWVLASIKKARAAGVSAKAVVGGPHPTFFPEMIEQSPVDVICRGEGEYALLDYATALDQGGDPYGIANLYFNVGGKIIKNPQRPLVRELDTLPCPDRSYYDRYNFLATNPFKIFVTGRGCPFQCTFCFNHALQELYGKTARYVRRRSVENVVNELCEVKSRWGVREVRFSDDHFTLNVEWLRAFASTYRKEIGVPYSVNARADTLDEEKIALLRESGCRLVCFGIETGRESLRNEVLRKQIKDEDIHRTASLLRKYRIRFLTSNIIGLPGETVEDAWQTVRINQVIRTDLPWFSMMQYYPGTQIFAMAKERSLLADHFDVDALGSYFRNDYLKQDNIDELQNVHSFSILVSWLAWLEPLARWCARHIRPNIIFRWIFKVSYLVLTARRVNIHFTRILRYWGHYFPTTTD